VESFETYRHYLFSIAYRMLGSAMDAEDMVQETYLRYQARPAEEIVSLKAYLTTILTRLCMDQLHLARRTREEYYPGPWLPEPLLTDRGTEVDDPFVRVNLDESLSLAFLVLLEKLQPVERAVFLLHEVFEYEYGEVATIVGKSEVTCRQLFSRARKHLAQDRSRFQASPEVHRDMLTSFMQAAQTGELATFMSILSTDVTLWADSGGKVRGAATVPISGPAAVAAFVLGTRRFAPANYWLEVAEINGQPAMLIRTLEGVFLVLAIEVENQRIRGIRAIANPDKLARLSRSLSGSVAS
jgi:RNA polymerase sigma-70 factor, ECF subfamily